MEPLPPLLGKGLASVTQWRRSQNEEGGEERRKKEKRKKGEKGKKKKREKGKTDEKDREGETLRPLIGSLLGSLRLPRPP